MSFQLLLQAELMLTVHVMHMRDTQRNAAQGSQHSGLKLMAEGLKTVKATFQSLGKKFKVAGSRTGIWKSFSIIELSLAMNYRTTYFQSRPFVVIAVRFWPLLDLFSSRLE